MIDTRYMAAGGLKRVQQLALLVGVVAAVLFVLGAFLDVEAFWHAYIFGYLFWLGIALGCLGVTMLQHLSGGIWGATARRFLEAGLVTIPVMGLLFLPVALFGMQNVYEWANPEAVAASELLQRKEAYLNVPLFLVRLLIYFAIWLALSFFLLRWSARYDETADPRYLRMLTRLSGPGMVIYVLTMTLAGTDFVMSLLPEWYSMIFPAIYTMGGILAGFALIIVLLALLVQRTPLRRALGPEHFVDLGQLLLAFVILWTYFSFSQFIIIWSGNLPVENIWYVRRLRDGWEYVAAALIIFQFLLPFLLLLSRGLKERPRVLALVAALIVFMQMVNVYWMVMPNFRDQLGVHLLDLVAPVAFGGIWLGVFLLRLAARPLLPLHVLPVHHPRHHVLEFEHAE